MGKLFDQLQEKMARRDHEAGDGGGPGRAAGLDEAGGMATGHGSDEVADTARSATSARKAGKTTDPVSYDPIAADPQREQEMRDRRDRWRPIILAGRRAREGYVLMKAIWTDVAAAREGGRVACNEVLSHLTAVQPGPHEELTKHWFVDAAATCFLLTGAMKDLGAGDTSEVGLVDATMETLQGDAPATWKGTPTNADDALKRAGNPKEWENWSGPIGPGQLRLAGADLAGAIEQFRKEKLGEGTESKAGGSSENKAPILDKAAHASVPRIAYVLECLDRGDMQADDPKLIAAVGSYFEQAQRFAYWAMALDPVEEPARLVAEYTAPLAKRFGQEPSVDADPIPRNEDVDSLGNVLLPALEHAWGNVFDVQANALQHLVTGEDAPLDWDQALLISLGTACLSSVLSAFAGGLGAAAAGGLADELGRGAASSLAKDVTKDMGTALAAGAPTSATNVRKAFFHSQHLAVKDAKLRALSTLSSRIGVEARRSPQGGAMVFELTKLVATAAADLEQLQIQRGVQAWANYQARAIHGTDKRTEGADLDAVGVFDRDKPLPSIGIDSPQLPPSSVPRAKAPRGLLEVRVRLGTAGADPVLEAATARGLADSDRAALAGLQLGELEMPVQIVGIFGGDEQILASSNGAGAYWLNEATTEGDAWLERRGGGYAPSPIDGVRPLFDDIAELTLAKIRGE